jgi:hypothetical protein
MSPFTHNINLINLNTYIVCPPIEGYTTEGHGNPCNVILGIAPPTVDEYHNLLIPLPIDDGEDDNFGAEDDGNA